MEQPPGSIDDLQPQDLSASGLPAVIDLTGPSDAALQSGDRIQPDDAFSHTTVTLSYVSRSHVFSTPDSLSRHSPLYAMPPVGKFSLHPSCDLDKGQGEETGYSLNQRYSEQAEGPVDLAAQSQLLRSLPQLQGRPEKDAGVCLTREPCEFNGGVVSNDVHADKQIGEEVERSLSWENSRVLENGRGDNRLSSGLCTESSPETLTPAAMEDEERGGPEVLLLVSKKRDAVVVLDGVAARDLCSLSREYISPLEDPVSPSATSLDDVEDVFVLPQASSSPSADSCYLETATEEVASDSVCKEGAIRQGSSISGSTAGWKAAMVPLIDLTDDVCASSVVEDKPKTILPHMNGNAKATQRTLKVKKLPMRATRGTRLDAIVMNINSGRYKVSGSIRAGKKARDSAPTASDPNSANPKRKAALSAGKSKSRARTSLSLKTLKQKAGTPVKRDKTVSISTGPCKKDSTSDAKTLSNSKKSQSSTPPKSPQFAARKRSRKGPKDISLPGSPSQTSPAKSKRNRSSSSSPPSAVCNNSKKEPELLSHPDPPGEIPPPPSLPKFPKKSPGKAKGRATGGKTPPTAKTTAPSAAKRRQKKSTCSQPPSMFSPKEPEIKLRYITYKEEKRDPRLDSFSPFIRTEPRQPSPSLCTVINYPEQVRTQHKKGQQQQAGHSGDFMSAVVPNTSCLQLGRASTHSQHRRALVCCLCGQSANAMDLGDLHGPYYPDGHRPSAKTPPRKSGLRDDDYSDSDSSSCSGRGRKRKCAAPPPPRPFRPGGQLKQRGLLQSHRRSGEGSGGSPAAKRPRPDAGAADAEDWYSPPVLPLEPCEYWLHEDCGIWSAGVFLVKGKVFGLEEAVKAAQDMQCSACREPGASLGCFFKACPNKYHYRCALQSADCVLVEENFSMKCEKHKDKTFRGPPGNRWDDR